MIGWSIATAEYGMSSGPMRTPAMSSTTTIAAVNAGGCAQKRRSTLLIIPNARVGDAVCDVSGEVPEDDQYRRHHRQRHDRGVIALKDRIDAEISHAGDREDVFDEVCSREKTRQA